jgi:flagellar biogenesis protein FliO
MQGPAWTNRVGGARQHGLAGMLLELWTKRRTAKEPRVRQMQLLETLPLGGKRQLMLVQCGGDRFLVGGGLESIQTIVRVDGQQDVTRRSQDGLCG